MNSLKGTLVLSTLNMLMIFGIELGWRTFAEPRGMRHEVGRKAHHIGIGFFAMLMPSYIAQWWVGFLLSVGFGAILLISYKFRLMRSLYTEAPPDDANPIFRRFQHAWIGPATYSIAVALVSIFFWQEPAIFRAALLILTLGDSAATVFGAWLGREYYHIFGTRRSLQGNAALLIVASLICAATLAPTGALSRALVVDVIATAVLFGLLLALTETISPFGLDNLTLPLMTAVVFLSLKDGGGTFAITGETVLAFAVVGVTAYLFTATHVAPRHFNGAALALGASTIILFDMHRYLFVAILLVFLACTLIANALAVRQKLADRRVGLEILGEVAPCVCFMAVREVLPNRGIEGGALACVVLLAARWWQEQLADWPALKGPATSAPDARPRWRTLALQGVVTSVAALIALAAGWFAELTWSPDPRAVTLLQVAVAATLGGLATLLVARPSAEPATGDSILAQVVPAMLAVSVIPAAAALVLGLVG